MTSLTYSILDGVFWSVMVGFGEAYFAPYILFLGGSDLLVGLLISLPLFAGSLTQLAAPWLVRRFASRRKLVRLGVFCQAVCYLPMIAIGRGDGRAPIAFLFLAIAYGVFHLAVAPAWQSWIGDLVPEENRGRYFSKRSGWIQVATFLSIVAAGLLLHRFTFSVIFAVAFAGRLVSCWFLGRQEEPPHRAAPELQFSFWEFVKKMQFNNYGLFVIFSSIFALAHYIAGPYFIPYMFKELHFTYFEFMLSQAVFVASKSVFLPLWGHYADRYGSRKLLSLAGYLIPIPPLLWLLARNYQTVIALQFFSGFVWAGFELCSFNFILDCTTPQRRARCAAYYQVFVGLGTVAGALLGGFLLKHPLIFSVPYFFLFLVSGVGRLYVAAVFLPKIRELRVVEPIAYRTLLLRMFLFQKPEPG